jgi:ABC-2 type transport system ATP-binding protein
MSQPQIIVEALTKVYRVPQRAAGLAAAATSLFRRSYLDVAAVQEVSFSIAAGEIVGLIGANGAGKTTTLKLLAGLLHPTSGKAIVAGHTPWERRPEFLQRISMVLGNKSQMIWDIPPLDTFRVLGEIYAVPPAEFRKTLDELIALLEMEALLTKPVRNFSLGERMKCELVAGLLHRPAVLFLDEPTLGLDVSMQARLRRFVAEYNRHSGATIILTSHYMADVLALCPRVIVIHEGRILYDGGLSQLAERLAPFKLLRVTLSEAEAKVEVEVWPEGAEVLERENGRVVLRVGRSAAPAVTAQLLSTLPVTDLTVEDPPLEAVIDRIYQGGVDTLEC